MSEASLETQIERIIGSLAQMSKANFDLSNRIEALADVVAHHSAHMRLESDNHVRQIDENRKISARVDEHRDILNDLADRITKCNNASTSLNNQGNEWVKLFKKLNADRMDQIVVLNTRLGELEKRFMEPVAQSIVDGLSNFYNKKVNVIVPHTQKKEEEAKFVNFSDALEALNHNSKVTRYSWRNKNIYVYLVATEAKNQLAELRVKTCNGLDCPWVPNNGELLADDWIIL